MYKVRSVVIAAVVVASAAAVSAPAVARGSAVCVGEGCEGLNPFDALCVEGAFIASLSYFRNAAGAGRVEMWYSPSCRANWAVTRVYEGPSDDMWAGIWKDGQGRISGVYDLYQGPGAPSYRYPFVYTAMIDGSVPTCAGGVNVSTGEYPSAEPACA